MFTIKTKLSSSSIHGLGVFADQFIKAGEIIHVFNSKLDVVLTQQQFDSESETTQNYLKLYSYRCPIKNGYVLCGDHGRFVNHSDNPNMKALDEDYSIAIRDIQIGEEITEDYYSFDLDAKLKLN